MEPKDRAKNAGPTLAEIKAAFPPESLAFFRAEVQRGGRIGIPKIERKQLGVGEGDTVSVLLMKASGKQKAKGERPQK
jgi:hypothetical protein